MNGCKVCFTRKIKKVPDDITKYTIVLGETPILAWVL